MEIPTNFYDTIKAHVLDNIYFEDGQEPTLENAVQKMYSEQLSHFRTLTHGHFRDALLGLPSQFTMPFSNWDIANAAYALGLDFDIKDDKEYYLAIGAYQSTCAKVLFDTYQNMKRQTA